jgi:type VI secretion system protein ImpK
MATSSPPSLFANTAFGSPKPTSGRPGTVVRQASSLVDALYDGFYMVFLLRNGYKPASADSFRESINGYLQEVNRAGQLLKSSSEDVFLTKFAFCALVDETVLSSVPSVRDAWERRPLQLEHFGENLAGEKFFEHFDKAQQESAPRTELLEVFHMCLLLGFQGKFALEGPEKLSYLTGRLGQDIANIKGTKASFAPNWVAPDKVKNALRNDIPLWVIASVFALIGLLGFLGLKTYLGFQTNKDLEIHSKLVQLAPKPATITITLP